MIGWVAIYCATVLWRQAIYTQIYYSPTISRAAPMGGNTHVPSIWRLVTMPAIRRTTRWWNPSRYFSNRGSETTSQTQTGAPLTPLTHRNSLRLSYMLPPLPRASPSVPIFSAPSEGSVPPPANCRWRTTTFVPGNVTKRPPSEVFHMTGRTSPPVPPYPQQPTYISSSTPHTGTLTKSGATDWGPTVKKYVTLGSPGVGLLPLLHD